MLHQQRNCALAAPLLWNQDGLVKGAQSQIQAEAAKLLMVPESGIAICLQERLDRGGPHADRWVAIKDSVP
jgi:hypothetical protein